MRNNERKGSANADVLTSLDRDDEHRSKFRFNLTEANDKCRRSDVTWLKYRGKGRDSPCLAVVQRNFPQSGFKTSLAFLSAFLPLGRDESLMPACTRKQPLNVLMIFSTWYFSSDFRRRE